MSEPLDAVRADAWDEGYATAVRHIQLGVSRDPGNPYRAPARAALAETRATLCDHGIPHNDCKENHDG